MYVFAGAIWRDAAMVALGVWIVAVSVAAPFFGYPAHYLVLAIAGGGGFLVAGLTSWVRLTVSTAGILVGSCR